MPSSLQSDSYIQLIERLRSLRLQMDVTQESLAVKLGRPQSFVSKTERRERRLDLLEFLDWAGALEIAPEELLKFVRGGTQ